MKIKFNKVSIILLIIILIFGIIIVGCSKSSLNNNEEEISAYKNFVINKEYKQYLYEYQYVTDFCLLDIDNNGEKELILKGCLYPEVLEGQDNGEYRNPIVWCYSYDKTNKKVNFLAAISDYDRLKYSEKYKSIVYDVFSSNSSNGLDYSRYCCFDESKNEFMEKLTIHPYFEDRFQSIDAYIYDAETGKELKTTQEEIDEYLNETKEIEFEKINNFTGEDVEDYSSYIGKWEYTTENNGNKNWYTIEIVNTKYSIVELYFKYSELRSDGQIYEYPSTSVSAEIEDGKVIYDFNNYTHEMYNSPSSGYYFYYENNFELTFENGKLYLKLKEKNPCENPYQSFISNSNGEFYEELKKLP